MKIKRPKETQNDLTLNTIEIIFNIQTSNSFYIGPSPDWVVGVSGLDLCQKDCSWIESITIDLYPYDAGTDNGISYMVCTQIYSF